MSGQCKLQKNLGFTVTSMGVKLNYVRKDDFTTFRRYSSKKNHGKPLDQGCDGFAEILFARAHHQFFSHRLFIVESCNSCHVDNKFVGAPVENVKISAKRAHPRI